MDYYLLLTGWPLMGDPAGRSSSGDNQLTGEKRGKILPRQDQRLLAVRGVRDTAPHHHASRLRRVCYLAGREGMQVERYTL
jgi:hypothetical protein